MSNYFSGGQIVSTDEIKDMLKDAETRMHGAIQSLQR